MTGKPEAFAPPCPAPPPPDLGALFDAYLADLVPNSKEAGSLATEAIHRGHLLRHLGGLPVTEVDCGAVQGYIRARSREKVLPVTIRKELTTLRMAWNLALRRKWTDAPVPWKKGDPSFPKGTPREPFKTRAEIERRLRRERPDSAAEARLWESLYLNEGEVVECLGYVRAHARHPFVFPMVAFAA